MASGNYCPNCGAALYVDGCHSCGWGRAPDPTEAPTPEPASDPTAVPEQPPVNTPDPVPADSPAPDPAPEG